MCYMCSKVLNIFQILTCAKKFVKNAPKNVTGCSFPAFKEEKKLLNQYIEGCVSLRLTIQTLQTTAKKPIYYNNKKSIYLFLDYAFIKGPLLGLRHFLVAKAL